MTTKTKTRRRVRMTAAGRLRDLQRIVEICFVFLADAGVDDLKELANRTGLSVWTLRRLANRRYSLYVRFNTIQSQAFAAGLRVFADDTGLAFSLVD